MSTSDLSQVDQVRMDAMNRAGREHARLNTGLGRRVDIAGSRGVQEMATFSAGAGVWFKIQS